MTADQLKDLITAGLPCEHIHIPKGDGTHWDAIIVSAKFEGVSRVGRRRLVYGTLGNRIDTNEVHAFSMQTLTPAEWAAAQV
ncbi:MAG: BolA family protein [Comamonas sp.]